MEIVIFFFIGVFIELILDIVLENVNKVNAKNLSRHGLIRIKDNLMDKLWKNDLRFKKRKKEKTSLTFKYHLEN